MVYPKLAKQIYIFLLEGYCNKRYEINGATISFHTKKDLISILREKMTSVTKEKIEFLIDQILNIYQGLDCKKQKTLDSYQKKNNSRA